MRTSPLEAKTVRPGLMTYSFYASSRRPAAPAKKSQFSRPVPRIPVKATRHHFWPFVVTLAIMAGVVIGVKSVGNSAAGSSQTPQISSSTNVSSSAATAALQKNNCANAQGQLVKVSISARHMWACQGSKQVYDSPVITGMEAHASTRTPTGTYRIYDKQTKTTLTGSDETGSWSDPVSYWMPFLTNQYGVYGFHDATWRPGDPFGHIDPNSDQASHGCVELPLSTAAWLYAWAPTGTTVTIQT